MSNFDITKYFKNQYISEAFNKAEYEDMFKSDFPNNREMSKEKDAKILLAALESKGISASEYFGSGTYDGQEGYYLKVGSIDYWKDEEIEDVKRAIELANNQTDKYDFKYNSVNDYEMEFGGDRSYPASIQITVSNKQVKENLKDYIKVSEPSFRKDKNNPNFLSGYIKYDTGGGSSMALGKETMSGQIRRLSSAEAVRQMDNIAKKLNDSFDIEDIEVTDLENGVVELFAVSDDFIDMDPRSELSMALLEENMSKEGIMRQIKDAEEILDSGEANGEPLTNETEMLVQNELKRLRSLLKSVKEMDINDPVLVRTRADKSKMDRFEKDQEQKIQNAKLGGGKDTPLRKLANMGKIAFLEKEREQLMRDMEQEAEPEGGPIADEYGRKLNRIDKSIAKLKGRKEMTYNQAIAEGHSLEDEDIQVLKDAFNILFVKHPDWKGNSDFRRIIQNLIDTNDVSGIKEVVETIKLGENMIEEELCAKGKAYRKRRMAAGEKSSAYLSGRAVKVCKGQMSGRKKKK